MPIYSFIDNNTGEEFSDLMSMEEIKVFLSEHPHIMQTFTPPNIGYSMVLKKPDSGFRDLLTQVKKSNRGSNINTY